MRLARNLVPAALLCALAAALALPAAGLEFDRRRGQWGFADVLEAVTPGVATIVTYGRPAPTPGPGRLPQFGPRRQSDVPGIDEAAAAPGPRGGLQPLGTGSGVVIDADEGLMLTNHHVIDNAERIEVVLADRRVLQAELVGSDPETDLALLRLDAEDLTEVPFYESDALRVGDMVMAIGNPYGIGQTATLGIVSAVGRGGLGDEGYEDYIQTDAAINPGNSGGALVDASGRLVGINTAIYSRDGTGNVGIGFAVPSDMARLVMAQLLEYGEVRRGRLGIGIRDLTEEVAEALSIGLASGALVTSIEPGSPAATAGLQAEDVITAIDGEAIDSARALRNYIGLSGPDAELELSVRRGDETLVLTAGLAGGQAVAGAPSLPAGPLTDRRLGARFAAMPDDHPLADRVAGVLVADVAEASPAGGAGMAAGDIVTHLNDQPIGDADALAARLEGLDGVAAFRVVRGNSLRLVIIGG